jgi:hypothetical protein
MALDAPAAAQRHVARLMAGNPWADAGHSGHLGLALLASSTPPWRRLVRLEYVAPGSGHTHAALLLGPYYSVAATVEGLNVVCGCAACGGAPPCLACAAGAHTSLHGLLA